MTSHYLWQVFKKTRLSIVWAGRPETQSQRLACPQNTGTVEANIPWPHRSSFYTLFRLFKVYKTCFPEKASLSRIPHFLRLEEGQDILKSFCPFIHTDCVTGDRFRRFFDFLERRPHILQEFDHPSRIFGYLTGG